MAERTVEEARELRAAVHQAYSRAALQPAAEHAFPVGRALAANVGYPATLLSRLPNEAVEAFAGVSCVACFADLSPGAIVLDLGCGAGLDTIIAAERVGPSGRVYAVDFSEAMLARARAAVRQARLANVCLLQSGAETLPLATACVDVALVNGIFNLNPARAAIFRELARVVQPGGTVYAAELVLSEPIPAAERTRANWFA